MKDQHPHENEHGQAIVILALAMIVLLAFAALAIDGGNAYVNRRRAQNGADAGALAGAHELIISRSGTATNIRAAINKAAEDNGMPDSDGVPGNAVNTYVQAYYTDASGKRLTGSNIEVSPFTPPPSNAWGIEVTDNISYPTFIAGIFSGGQQSTGVAEAQAAAIYKKSEGCDDYAVYGAGPSGNHQSIHETGSNLTFYNGGLYGGDGGRFNNVTIVGNPPPPVDVVQPCNGCQVSGTTANFNTTKQDPLDPPLYDIADYQPGGKYSIETGWTSTCTAPNGCGNYHYISGDFNPPGNPPNLSGLYFVEGSVKFSRGAVGTASIVSRGPMDLSGNINLTTFDYRFPVLASWAEPPGDPVSIHNSDIELHGFIYVPNGSVNMSGAHGKMFGAIYGQEVKFAGSILNFYYEPHFCPPNRARVLIVR